MFVKAGDSCSCGRRRAAVHRRYSSSPRASSCTQRSWSTASSYDSATSPHAPRSCGRCASIRTAATAVRRGIPTDCTDARRSSAFASASTIAARGDAPARGARRARARSSTACEALERERRALIQAVEERKAARNALAGGRPPQEGGRGRRRADRQARALGEEITRLERELARRRERARAHPAARSPTSRCPTCPTGGEEHNVVVRSWGDAARRGGRAPALGDRRPRTGCSISSAARRSAARASSSIAAPVRGWCARCMNFFLDSHAREHGYEEVWPPLLVNRATMTGTGQLPKFEDDAYKIAGDELFLIPTAEVPVTNLYRDEILDARHAADGVLRVHAVLPSRGRLGGKGHARDSAHAPVRQGRARALLRARGFARRSSSCCSATRRRCCSARASVSRQAARGGRHRLLEREDVRSRGMGARRRRSGSRCRSCSNFTDFQARRANIRYRPAAGEKPRFVHTLNGSGLAFPRTIACHSRALSAADGTVAVPEALRPYLGTDRLGVARCAAARPSSSSALLLALLLASYVALSRSASCATCARGAALQRRCTRASSAR